MDGKRDSVLSEDDWASLASTVSAGKCTLMLGPGTVTGRLAGVGMPAHVALATYVKDRLADQLDQEQLALLDPEHPSSVAQVAMAREDPVTLGRWIGEFHREFEVDREMLDDLAALPFPLVVNTSPDIAVFEAFAQARPGTLKEHYNLRAPATMMMPEPECQAPVVYHLYGVFEQPESMILSDSDRLDFVIAVASGNPPLPRNLLSQMQDIDRTFLFLGFDLADWQFRILLHVLARNVNRRYKSFAFDLDADPVDPATKDFYRRSHKIHFFKGDLSFFARELRRRCDEVAGKQEVSGPGVEVVGPDTPIVFLCHASEDKDRVEQLAVELRSNGIRTWLDKENLRGGDRWDACIRQTLRDVNYVVVVQSESLVRKGERRSYVNREISIALDVQQEYAASRAFVIPVLLDGSGSRREELRDLHTIDLTDADGMTRLVRAIKRDFEEERLR